MEEKVYFKSGKLRLNGILNKTNSDFCIILCHGITVDKEDDGVFTYLAKELYKKGFSSFRFDFRAHGKSEGKQTDFTIKGQEKDILSAVKFLQKRGYKKFGIIGASFAGGSVSIFSSKHDKIMKFVVMWNALIDYNSFLHPKLIWPKKYFSSIDSDIEEKCYVEVGSRKFRMGKKIIREMRSLKPWKSLEKYNKPILFIHGDKDDYVPYRDSLKFSRMLKAEMKTIKGGQHGFENKKKEASKAVIDFILGFVCITSP